MVAKQASAQANAVKGGSLVSMVAKQASAQANAVKGGSLVSIVVQSNPTQAVDWSKSGLNTLDLTSTSQQFKFYKLKSTATSPLGTTVNDWHTDGVTSPLRSGDTVAWYHPAANQLYDCAWGTCTKQRWNGLPAGFWGSPYRIYKEGGAVGDVIALDSAIYFDRMFHGVFNPTKSIAIGKSTAIAGVSMSSKTIFVLKAQDARAAAVARAAKVVEERGKATQRAAEQRTKAAKVVEERTKAAARAVVEQRTKATQRAAEQRTKAAQRAAAKVVEERAKRTANAQAKAAVVYPYSKQYSGNCKTTGKTMITSEAACKAAAAKLGLGRVETDVGKRAGHSYHL